MSLIHLISDLHLEFGGEFPLIPNVDILILAGDITTLSKSNRYHEFLSYCTEIVSEIIMIAGNHEYYHTTKSSNEIDEELKMIAEKFKNVHFLQQSYVDLFGFRFIGCTLWSNIPSEYSDIIHSQMSDYRKIFISDEKLNKRLLTIEDTLKWHAKQCDYLIEQIHVSPNPIIIITHHAPIIQSNSKRPIDYAFGTDLKHIINDKVILWTYGHTHQSWKESYKFCTIWSNPIGYPDEYTGYSVGDIIQL